MQIRTICAEDIRNLQESSKKGYDKLDFPENLEDSFVLADETGKARVIFMAERVAEVYLLLDHEWETPAMRWEAVRVGIQEMRRRLEAKGYRAAYAYFGEGVPDGWIRRLVKAGAEVQKRIVRFAR